MEMKDYEESGRCSLVKETVMNFSEVISITYCFPLGSHLLFLQALVSRMSSGFVFHWSTFLLLVSPGLIQKSLDCPSWSPLSKPWSPCAVWVPSSLPTPFPSSAELRGSVVSPYGGLACSPVAPWSELRLHPAKCTCI